MRDVGLVIFDVANPLSPTLGRAVEGAAYANGCALLLGNHDDAAVREAQRLVVPETT